MLVLILPPNSDTSPDLRMTELDVDGSGVLEDNELLTLVSMAVGKEPTMAQVNEIQECMERAGEAHNADSMSMKALVRFGFESSPINPGVELCQ